jgi:hypothetical protein
VHRYLISDVIASPIQDVLAITVAEVDSSPDPVELEGLERDLLGYLAMLEEYQCARYGTLRDACMGEFCASRASFISTLDIHALAPRFGPVAAAS